MTARYGRGVASGGVRRGAGLWPFGPTSPWNIPIGSGATFQSATDPATADMLDLSYTPDVAVTQWTHPIYFASATDPLVTVTWGGGDVVYRIPVGAEPSPPDIDITPDTDSHLHVIQPDGTVGEAYYFQWTSSTTATAGYVTINALDEDGITDGVRGYGGSAIGGLIRKHEINNRYIPHAIALAPYWEAMLLEGFKWPATREDAGAPDLYHGAIGMGEFAAIPPSVNLASLGLNADGLALATAMQDYGIYVVDVSQNWAVYAELGADATRAAAMLTDLPTIRAQVRVVTNNSEVNRGGPGTRRRPLAPRLALR